MILETMSNEELNRVEIQRAWIYDKDATPVQFTRAETGLEI